MTVFICVLGAETKRLEWNLPFLPRIGEHLYIEDFVPDIDSVKVHDDVLKVVDIQWIKLDGEICATLFLECDDSETPNVKPFRLN